MFAQAEEKRIIYNKKRNHTRPGEVLFKSDGALAQAKSGKAAQAMPKTNPLDEAKASDLHRKLMATYRYELDRQAPNRVEMATDEDMFDHIQWTVEELVKLEERGQPPLIFNLIQTTVNWVLGSQRRATAIPVRYPASPSPSSPKLPARLGVSANAQSPALLHSCGM